MMHAPKGRLESHIQGFTLIELMVTLTVAAILLAVAVPGFSSFIKKNRLDTQQNVLFGSISYARSEAMSRGRNVTLCASSDGASCTGSWSQGWIVYMGDTTVDTPGGDVLRVFEALTGGNKLVFKGDSSATKLSFRGRGFADTTGSFELCDADTAVTSDRKISIANTGRPTLSTGDLCT